MTVLPKQLTRKFFPNLGETHEIGLADVGVTVVDFTLTMETVQTVAQILASPPNTAAVPVPTGVVVHSLGDEPECVITQWRHTMPEQGVGMAFITADNSAVYVTARAYSGGVDGGAAARIIAIR